VLPSGVICEYISCFAYVLDRLHELSEFSPIFAYLLFCSSFPKFLAYCVIDCFSTHVKHLHIMFIALSQLHVVRFDDQLSCSTCMNHFLKVSLLLQLYFNNSHLCVITIVCEYKVRGCYRYI